jgi:hypothetical protein
MGLAVDHHPTTAADAFPAVMLERHWLLSLAGQPLIEDIEHLQKGHLGR